MAFGSHLEEELSNVLGNGGGNAGLGDRKGISGSSWHDHRTEFSLWYPKVCMCVYRSLHVCEYMCDCVSECMCVLVWVSVCICVECMYMCVSMYIYVSQCGCVHRYVTRVHMCMHVRMCKCICVCRGAGNRGWKNAFFSFRSPEIEMGDSLP